MSYIAYPSDPPPVFPTLPNFGFPIHRKPFFTAWQHKAITGAQWQTARQVYPNWEFVLQAAEDSWFREQTQNSTLFTPNSPHVELETISQLFLSCFGSYGDFWYNDLDDNSRTGQLIGTGNATTTVFRIVRTWGFDALSRVEPVGGVNLSAPINVYFNGSLQSSSIYTVTNDLTGSHLNFTSPPGAGIVITMDFTFYYRCKFKTPTQQYDQWARNLWQLRTCEFQSVKP